MVQGDAEAGQSLGQRWRAKLWNKPKVAVAVSSECDAAESYLVCNLGHLMEQRQDTYDDGEESKDVVA